MAKPDPALAPRRPYATISDVRSRARAIVREHRADPAHLAKVAIQTAADGDQQLTFELFRASPRAVATLSRDAIEGLLVYLYDWNSTDCFGSFVSGVAWRQGMLRDTDIKRWAKSPHLWTRRAALVSTVPLNLPARGATAPKGEPARTLAVCDLLASDREDMIVKAESWALRVLAMRDPIVVRNWVRTNQQRLAARVLREVGNKLTTGLKNPKTAAKGRSAKSRSAKAKTSSANPKKTRR